MAITLTGPHSFAGSYALDARAPLIWVQLGPTASTGAVIAAQGDLYTWGSGLRGVLGDNTVVSKSSPVKIPGSWTFVVGGFQHRLAIKPDGSLWSWGSGINGQHGLNDRNHRSSPTQIGTSSWTTVASQGDSSFAVRSDGTLWAWGLNLYYNLGIPLEITDPSYSSPVQIGTDTNWLNAKFQRNVYADLSQGAVKSDGSLWQWGSDAGTGTLATNSRLAEGEGVTATPEKVGTSSWVMIDTSYETMAAIRVDGGLFTWGTQSIDRIDVENPDRSSPVQIGTESWTWISGGYDFSGGFYLAIRADGTLWSWGYNAAGQLGLNDRVHRSSPTQIGTDTWSYIQAGFGTTYGIKTDNTVWAWGAGTGGRLGIGTTLPRSSPVQITALPF